LLIEEVTLAEDQNSAVVKCQLFHRIQPRINASQMSFDQKQDVRLVKQNDVWVIAEMKNR
jgi:hypothetical protein